MMRWILILLYSSLLFGVQLQQAPPLLKELKGAKVLNYEVEKATQITLKIPVELEPTPVGMKVNGHTIAEGYRLTCIISNDRDPNNSYSVRKKISAGNKTIVMKFNNIPFEEIVNFNQYFCYIFINTRTSAISHHYLSSVKTGDSVGHFSNSF